MPTTTENGAYEAILAHHADLRAGVERRVQRLSAAAGGGHHEPAVADLVAYLAEEVLPHASAEERSIYPIAAAKPALSGPVGTMIDEHRQLGAAVCRLATANDATEAAREAEAISTLFATHVAKENDLVLPDLAADDTVELTGLLGVMHRLTEAARTAPAPAAQPGADDTESGLLSLLLDATGALADAGKADRACRLTAAAWALLRSSRPDLGIRLTAALHRLARSTVVAAVPPPAGHRPAGGEVTLDVRTLAPAGRHEAIFTAYDALGPGGSFVLVNDHDPKPLRYQFEAEQPGHFTWEYQETGPRVWRVRIGRR